MEFNLGCSASTCGFQRDFNNIIVIDLEITDKAFEQWRRCRINLNAHHAQCFARITRIWGADTQCNFTSCALHVLDMESAAAMLGRPYSLSAPVVRGSAVGSRLGFPTINQEFTAGRLVPKTGVYISACIIDKTRRPAVTDIGVRPTFGGQDELRCETHIIGYDGELYGRTVKTEFYKYLRPEQKFDSPAGLAAAVRADIGAALEYFEKADIF